MIQQPNRRAGLFSRDEWIRLSSFYPESEGEFCGKLEQSIRTLAGTKKRPPAIVLDLDSTLYQVSPRSHFILREAADVLSKRLPSPVRRAFNSLLESHVGYSIQDTFSNLGLRIQSPAIQKAWQSIRAFWWERFFSDSYLKYDRPYLLASHFVRRMHANGAHILYLTGRNNLAMREGTLANLQRDGFPLDSNTLLRMKMGRRHPMDRHSDDATFKARIAGQWAEKYNILACFENEPRNLVSLARAVPESMPVFVDTVCSDKPSRVGKGLYRLRSYPPRLV